MKRYLVVLIALGCSLGVNRAVHAYTFTDFLDPSSNGTYTVASGINDSAQIVGYFQDTSVVYHGFLCTFSRRGGCRNFVTIDEPNAGGNYGQGTFLSGITDRGTTVGAYIDSSGVQHGFVRDRAGRFITIDPPGSTTTDATGVNLSGQIVGWYYNGAYQGFLRSETGHFTPIDDPDACYGTFPFGISETGEIVGSSSRCDHGYGFVRDRDGTFTAIDPLGATYTFASGIDQGGHKIVGVYQNYPYGFCFVHGYLLLYDIHGDDETSFTTLDDPAASGCSRYEQGTWPQGVNSYGTVVGYIVDPSGEVHGFVATRGD
jgi:uncharacterized membrane protein